MKNTWICECGRENSGDVCTKCQAPRAKLTEGEKSEKIRAKEMKLLSSGIVLALTVFIIIGAVFYGLGILGTGGTVALLFLTGASTVSGTLIYIVVFCEYVFFAVAFTLCADALIKARSASKLDDAAGGTTALEKIRKLLVSYRVFFIVAILLTTVLMVFSLFEAYSTMLSTVDGMEDAEIFTRTYMVAMTVSMVIAVAVSAVVQVLYNVSMTRLVDKIKARIAEPLSKRNGKCTSAAVFNFFYFGIEVLLAPLLIFMGVLFAIAVIAMASSGAMGAMDEATIAAVCIVAIVYAAISFAAAGLVLVVSVPYLLLGIAAVKHNKIEKYAASLVNEVETAVQDEAPQVLTPTE